MRAPDEDALLAALGAVDDAWVIPTADGEIVYVNAAFVRASGFAIDAAVGRRLDDLQRPRPAEHGAAFVVTRADGVEYLVERRRSRRGERVVEVQRDVTGAERSASALRARQALDRLVAERSSDVISRLDPRGVCTYVSPSCRAVLGYEPAELIGRSGFDLAHPDEQAPRREAFGDAIARGDVTATPVTTRVRRKDGAYVWLETVSQVVRDANGAILEIQSAARDVTARVEAERALVRAEADLKSLLERLPDAVVVHRDGRIVHANARFVALIGARDAAELVGLPALDLVAPQDRALVDQHLRHEAVGGTTREHTLLRRDGGTLQVEVSAIPVTLGGRLAWAAIVADLTERRRVEEQLAVAERMASIGRLASAVGHEINNPLTYILASLEVAGMRLKALRATAPPEVIEELRDHLETAREGANRVRVIVRDLRQLSAAPDEARAPVDVATALDRAAATAMHEIRVRARLVKDYAPVPPAYANDGRLVQLFVNLFVNAAQAIPEGHAAENEIRAALRERDGAVVVEIQDTGVGLAPEHAARIFEPFFTTKAKSVGTGLGLAIAHRIVTELGGTIEAEPASPRGTLFRVVLPAAHDAPSEHGASPVPTRASPVEARLLVVDDEPAIARVLSTMLGGYDVEIATSGREAIARLERGKFDAILCDLQMNDGSGIDLYEHLAKTSPGLERRIVFMTGGAFTDRAREFLASTAQPCLDKPFGARQVHEAVAKVIAGAPR